MTSLKEFENRAKIIDDLVYEKIVTGDDDISPITDGIIDIKKYLKAKYKILWILKEPYDDFDKDGEPFGGDWDLKEMVRSKKTIYDFGDTHRTFRPMTLVSWGILNDFCMWDDMSDVQNDPEMLEALKSTAYINVKKTPGYKKSYYPVIAAAYQQNKEILLKQIIDYEPEIIIGGYTLGHFINDLGFSRENMKNHGSLNYIIKDNKIYIDAYHPAQRPGSTGVSEQDYCDDIINVAKIWAIETTR